MKTIKRKLALAMAAVMAVCSVPSMPPAWARTAREFEIVRFEKLPEETLYQQVEYGTKKRSLDLPRYLYAEIREVYEDTDDEDDADEVVIATASNASAVKKATAFNAEWETSSKKSVATPSNAAVSATTPSNATPSDADKYGSGDWKRVRVNWVLNESFSEQDEYDGEVPGIYVFEAELARDRYVLGDAELPWIEIEVLEKEEVQTSVGAYPVSAQMLTTGLSLINLSNAEVTVNKAYTYNGSEQALDITVTVDRETVNPSYYSVPSSIGPEAGTIMIFIEGDYDNTTGGKEIEVTIEPAELTVTEVIIDSDRVYNGTNEVEVTGVTLSGVIGTDSVEVDRSYLTGYVNSINAGTYTSVQLDGTWELRGDDADNYTVTNTPSEVSTNVTISPKMVDSGDIGIELYQDTYEYDGTEKKPDVTVKDVNTVISPDEYTVEYSDNVDSGTATVKISDAKTGSDTGNYTLGDASTTFTITQASLQDAWVELSKSSYTYDGTVKTPEVTTVALVGTGVSSSNYTVSYSNNINAGTATVTVTGTGNYSGSATEDFTITQKELTVTGATASGREYDGTDVVTVTGVSLDGVVGSDDVAVDVTDLTGTLDSAEAETYTSVTLPQTLSLTGTFAGNYTLTQPDAAVSTDVTISPKTAGNLSITLSQDTYEYDGTAKEPGVTVTDGGKEISSSEYTVGYTDNVDAGTATVTITDTVSGNYTIPETIQTFTITQKELTVTGAEASGREYDATDIVTVTGVTLDGVVSGDDVAVDVTGLTGMLNSADAGNYTSVTLSGTLSLTGSDADNYTVTQPTSPVSTAVTISSKWIYPHILVMTYSYEYDGQEKKPEVVVFDELDGTTEIPASEYTVTYANNIEIGTATLTVKDVDGGNYTVAECSTEFIIEARKVYVVEAQAQSRKYDGLNWVLVTSVTVKGVYDGDDVSVNILNQLATVESSAAGTYTSLTFADGALSLTGNDADIYTLVEPGAVNTNVTIWPDEEVAVGAETAVSSTVKYSDSDSDDDSTAVQSSDGGQWILGERGWWYSNNSGGYPKGEWKQIDWLGSTNWYYFDEEGWMATGWLDWDGKRYYLHADSDGMVGHMYTGWQLINGDWYYFDEDGALLVNGTAPDGIRTDGNGVRVE
ncbi:MAG: YDG domain-containing protein [Clostridiales bacterium]|nr:YDG domain-containing protein [Clostridiales bacterium]